MARSNQNVLTKYYSGKFGDDFGFRNYNGKSVMAKLPGPRKYKSSEKQEGVMSRFRLAVSYARGCRTDPAANGWYRSKPKKGNSVYRLALKDYLNVPVIEQIRTAEYKGHPGDQIVIIATDDFGVAKVEVRITDAKGRLIEFGACTPDSVGAVWVYQSTAGVRTAKGITITATAYDRPGNKGEDSITLA